MGRVTVITDVDTKLGYALLLSYFEGGEKAIGISSVKKKDLANPGSGKLDIIEWNRHSAIDSKSVIIEIVRKYKAIDEVILVQSLAANVTSLADTDFSLINREIDYWLKGNLYFAREVLKLFADKKSGALALVNHALADEKNHRAPLAEALQASFAGLTRSLLPLYAGKEVCINGFESVSELHNEFARFIYKNMCDRFRKISGKHLVFGNQKSIFGALKRN